MSSGYFSYQWVIVLMVIVAPFPLSTVHSTPMTATWLIGLNTFLLFYIKNMFSLFLQKVVLIPNWIYLQIQFYFYYHSAMIWVCNRCILPVLEQNWLGDFVRSQVLGIQSKKQKNRNIGLSSQKIILSNESNSYLFVHL